MEPFKLTLTQVNFEEQELTSDPDLNSFSNLFYHDSDFKADDPAGLPPIASKEITQFKQAHPATGPTVEGGIKHQPYSAEDAVYYYHGDWQYNQNRQTEDGLDGVEHSMMNNTDIHKLIQSTADQLSHTPDEAADHSHPMEEERDSFTAFTETVEALALQKSVIGDRSIKPASADEIARVIAETQQRLGIHSSGTDEDIAQVHAGILHPLESHLRTVGSVTYQGTGDSPTHSVATKDPHTARGSLASGDQPVANHTVPSQGDRHGDSQPVQPTPAFMPTQDDKVRYYDFVNEKVIEEAYNKTSEPLSQTADRLVTVDAQSNSMNEASVHPVSSKEPSAKVQRTGESPHAQYSSGTGEVAVGLTQLSAEVTENSDVPHHVVDSSNNADVKDVTLSSSDSHSKTGKSASVSDTLHGGRKRTDSVDSNKSKESTDSSRSKELIRIYPTDVKREKATWSTGGPPMEKQRPKHMEEEISVTEKDTSQGSEHVDLGAEVFTVTNHEPDGVTVSGVYNNMEVSQSEQILVESEVVVTQSNQTATSPDKNVRNEEGRKSMETHTKERTELQSGTKTDTQQSEQSIHINKSSEPSEPVTKYRDSPILMDRQLKTQKDGRQLSQSSSVVTSTPLKSEQEMPPSVSATPVVNARSPHSQPHPAVLNAQQVPMQREHSNSNLSVSDNVSENRSRASSVSSISALEFLQNENASQNESISFVAYDLVKQELERALKEKAKLEGQNEVLQEENKLAIKQRADLQSQVAGLIIQSKANESMHNKVIEERNSLAVDLDLLKQKRTMLEHVIVDSNKLLEEKTSELKTLQEDYQISQENNKKLEDKFKDTAQETKAKEGTIQALKNKVAELYVEFQSTNQGKIHAENELKASQSEILSLKNAKEWYDKQIKTLQESSSNLKNELTRVQGQSIAQGTLVERMKAENVRMRQLQTDMQQKALMDKEALAKQLEAIEADILQREAQFQELLQERDAYSEVRNRHEMGEVQGSSSDMSSDEVRKMQHDLRRREAEVKAMEHEQKELVKRLTLSQESILERDKSLESLERKYIEVETQLSQIQQEMFNKEEEYLKLKEERHSMEIAMTSAKEEKGVIDEALKTVKTDMGKVEKTFKQMKLELTNKKDELESALKEKEKLHSEMETLRDQLEQAVASRGSTVTAKSESLSDEEKIKLAESSKVVADLKVKVTSLETEMKNLKHELSVAEVAKQAAGAEKTSMQQELEVTRGRLDENDAKLKSLLEEKGRLEGELEVSRLNTDNSAKLEQELLGMKGRLADVQKDSHREIAKQKGKALKLGSDLSRAQKELKKKTTEYEATVSSLQQQLTEMTATSSRREEDLQRLQERFTLDLEGQRESLTAELATLKSEFEVVRASRHQLEAELSNVRAARDEEKEKYKKKLEKLEGQLEAVREFRDRQQSMEENKKQLALDLEKERGKYTGILQSHSALKEHTHILEEALAARESSVAEMSSHVQEEFIRRDKMAGELKQKIKELEEQLNREKAASKDSKKQLMTEKGKGVKLRREHEALRTEHDRLLVKHETVATTLQLLELDLKKVSQSEEQYRTQLEKIMDQYNEVKVEHEQLKREAEERSAKDPLTQEQIKTLQWQNEQKATELEAVQEQLQLAEERQTLEVENLRQTLQNTSSELMSLRTEISSIKQEKVRLQTKVTELKGALKSTIIQLKSIGESPGARPRMDLSALEQLLQDSATASDSGNKPLSFLQATLSGLRGEISTLQKQVDEHTAAVKTSTTSWRELESQVQALRDVCRSSTSEKTVTITTKQVAASSEENVQDKDSLESRLLTLAEAVSNQGTKESCDTEPTNENMSQISGESQSESTNENTTNVQ